MQHSVVQCVFVGQFMIAAKIIQTYPPNFGLENCNMLPTSPIQIPPDAVPSIPGAPCRVAHFGQRAGVRLAEFPAVHGEPGTRRTPRCHHRAQVQDLKVFGGSCHGNYMGFVKKYMSKL